MTRYNNIDIESEEDLNKPIEEELHEELDAI